MELNKMAKIAYDNSKAKGFWGAYPPGPLSPDVVACKLALIHSEVSEALEDARDGKMKTYLIVEGPKEGKPCGFPSELADIIIRVGDLAERMGIDLENEMVLKMAYNAKRPHKHGKAI